MQSVFCPAARRPVGGQTDHRGLAARWARNGVERPGISTAMEEFGSGITGSTAQVFWRATV
jgi:hypothetical protein